MWNVSYTRFDLSKRKGKRTRKNRRIGIHHCTSVHTVFGTVVGPELRKERRRLYSAKGDSNREVGKRVHN